jgi:hypothetical protein
MSPCDMRPKSKFKHCEKIWKKSCTFTAHIKITPKNFRSKFETYIEKQKRETQMWIVYRETQIWIRELFMTDFSFLFLDVCFEFWSENFRGYFNMCCEHAWFFSDLFAMFKFEFKPHVTRWHAIGACHLICGDAGAKKKTFPPHFLHCFTYFSFYLCGAVEVGVWSSPSSSPPHFLHCLATPWSTTPIHIHATQMDVFVDTSILVAVNMDRRKY